MKLWDVGSGERRDTLSQPAKEQFAVAWSVDGKRLAAAGAAALARGAEFDWDAITTRILSLYGEVAATRRGEVAPP